MLQAADGLGQSGGSWTEVTKNMRLASALLDSYERQVETIEGALKELEDNMDDARQGCSLVIQNYGLCLREEWHMQLDSVRNRFIRINLIISILSLSVLTCTIPAGALRQPVQ